MIARRTGDDTFCFLGIRELRNFVIGATHFERACALQTFGFQIDLHFRIHLPCLHQCCGAQHLAQHRTGVIKVI